MTSTPQFTFEDLYISPFSSRRRYDEDGNVTYIALQHNLTPSGINLLDEFLQRLRMGNSNFAAFCRKHGIKQAEFSHFVKLLTGMSAQELRLRYCRRMLDELLRYTNLTPDELGRRSGLGGTRNLNHLCRDHYGDTPLDRRRALRKRGDLGRYKL